MEGRGGDQGGGEKLTEMDKHVGAKVLAVDNLALAGLPHDGRLRVELGENVALPALGAAPPVLVLAEVEGVGGGHPGLVHVGAGGEAADVVGRVAEGVDVVLVDVAVGGDVAVLGRRVAVPPHALVAEPLGDGGHAVDDLELGDAGSLVVLGIVLRVFLLAKRGSGWGIGGS